MNGILSKGALLAPPAIAGFSSFAPPWPDSEVATGFFISVFELVAVLYLFSMEDRIKAKYSLYLLWTGRLLFAVFLVYVVLFATLTAPMERASHRDVIGFLFQDASFRHYQTDVLLKMFGYDPEKIWLPWTVVVSRILVLLSWIAVFVVLSCYFGIFYLKYEHDDGA